MRAGGEYRTIWNHPRMKESGILMWSAHPPLTSSPCSPTLSETLDQVLPVYFTQTVGDLSPQSQDKGDKEGVGQMITTTAF